MEKQYTLNVNTAEANLLAAALHEMPYKFSAPLIAKLQKQITEQEQASETVASE